MIRCIFEDRIEIVCGRLARTVNARWKSRKYGIGNMDVFRQYDDDGSCLVRGNLMYCTIGGYYLYDNEETEWSKAEWDMRAFKETYTREITPEEIAMLKDRYPGFRWMLDKVVDKSVVPYISVVWKYLQAWKRWPECERLFDAGLKRLCASKTFAELPYLKQKKVVEWMRQHPGKDWGLGQIRTMMANGMTEQEYDRCKSYRIGIRMMRYLDKQVDKHPKSLSCLNYAKSYYSDYIKMAERAGHDIKDEYWAYPNDLKKAHDKVLRECERIRAAKEKERMDKYVDAVKKWLPKSCECEGMRVYVPETYEEFKEQAESLSQCLMYADYIGKVSEGKCLIVFIRCKDKPMATAEISPSGKILQFYGDESDYDNCAPGQKEKNALDAWLQEFKPKWKKKEAA